jgi:uncharacterized membrane protein
MAWILQRTESVRTRPENLMRTPASIAKHPLHPILVGIPIGLWVFSLFCDLAMLAGATSTGWQIAAFYTMVGGLIGALIAAVPGLIDLLSLHSPRIRTIALTHMTLNLVVVVLYAVNVWLRMSEPADLRLPMLLSVIAIVLLAVSGWLGGEMVHVHRVGVEESADAARVAAKGGSTTRWEGDPAPR